MTKARTLADNFAADINGITAGTGITGGGTSGTVTITNDMATTIAAKGDLLAGTANDAYAALTAGTNEQRLVADSAQATGLKYVADTTNYAIAAKGDILVGTAADTLAALTVGANDTVLTADSAQATGLKWATVASGGMTLISTTTLSGTQTNLTSIPGTYKSLLLRITGSYGNTVGNLSFRFNNDSTNPAYAVLKNSNYQTGYSISGLGGVLIDAHYCHNTSVGTANIVELYLPNYASTTTKKYTMIQGATRQNATGNIDLGLFTAYWDNTSAVTQINILGLGTFTAGTALLYGVN